MRALFLSALFLLSLPAAAVEVSQWKDADGKIHYGDKPKFEAKALDVKPGSGDGGAAQEKEKAEAAKAARCKQESDELARARQATGLRETDSKGKTRDLSAEERAAYIKGVEKRVTAACGTPPESVSARGE